LLRSYDIPYSQRHSLSVDTLLDWALRYRRGGLPPWRSSLDTTVGPHTPQLAELIEQMKRENPHRTGATLLRELTLVSSVGTVSPATLYRFLKRRGLTARQLLARAASKKLKRSLVTKSGNPTCCSDPMFSAPAPDRWKPSCMPS